MRLRATRTLVGHHWRLHHRPLLPMAAALALFQYLLTQIAPAPNETSWIAGMLALMPQQMRDLAGGDLAFASTEGFLSTGYQHPFFLLLLSAWAIRVSSASLAGEIGRGTMDLLGSRPVRRVEQVWAATCSIAVGLALVVGAAWAGTAIGLVVRPLGVSAWPFLRVAGAAWLLFMAWGAVGVLASATQREAGPAIAWTSGIMAVSFVLEYLSRIWTLIEPLRSLSLFAYYHPPEIVRTGLGIFNALCLASAALALTLAAIVVFRRRDL